MMQYALMANTHSIILTHNHLYGSLFPGEADLKESECINKALKTLEIQLIFHLFVSPDEEYKLLLIRVSYRYLGYLPVQYQYTYG